MGIAEIVNRVEPTQYELERDRRLDLKADNLVKQTMNVVSTLESQRCTIAYMRLLREGKLLLTKSKKWSSTGKIQELSPYIDKIIGEIKLDIDLGKLRVPADYRRLMNEATRTMLSMLR